MIFSHSCLLSIVTYIHLTYSYSVTVPYWLGLLTQNIFAVITRNWFREALKIISIFSHCHNPNSNQPQPNITPKIDTKMTLANRPTTTHPTHTNTMSAISQLLRTQFWPNFEGRFQNFLIFRTRSFYLIFSDSTFFLPQIFLDPKIFGPTVFLI